MVKAPILSPTPPSSTSLSPTNEGDPQVDSNENSLSSTAPSPTRATASNPSSTRIASQNEKLEKVKIRLDDLVMGDTELKTLESVTGDGDDATDQTEQQQHIQDTDLHEIDQNESKSDTNDSTPIVTKSVPGDGSSSTNTVVSGSCAPLATLKTVYQPQMLTPITIGIAHQTPPPPPQVVQQIPQQSPLQQQQQQQGPPHHHIFPGYVISIPPPGPPGSTTVTSAWPLVEAPIYLDANGEPRHYCPAHPQGPAPPPREHCVLLQLDAGVSLPLQIAGKRKVFRANPNNSNIGGSGGGSALQQQQQQQHQQLPTTQSSTSSDGSSLPPSPPLIHHHHQIHQAPAGGIVAGNLCAIHHHQQLPPHQQQAQQLPMHLTGPPMNHHHIHHHHHPPNQQQQQQHENGHGVGGGGGGGGGGGSGPGGTPTNGPNTNGNSNSNGGPNSSWPPLFIPYTGDYEHAYFIPHHHEMCPAHHPAAMCTMPSDYGPTTVQMVSQNRPPPIPVPVQVPQGQVMQQYVNESGTLTHVVLSQYPQLHAGQGGVPHIHAPFIATNGSTPHFYSPLAGGYPGPGGGPHFHQIPGGHLQPQQMSHSPHSPSPPSNYHKDERTQRQHTKLLRKLDQKREISSAMSTPAHSPSPRKNDLNGLRRTSRNGASSVGTSEDGEESSSVPDEEDDCQAIIEHLSAVQKPEVTDITSRSAMLRWEAPPFTEGIPLNSRGLRYFVLLSDRGKEGKYKIIFKGESYVCMIQDLRPGQEYFVCLQVHFDKLEGSASEPAVFKTPPCEPDQPLPPKLSTRTKNSIQLRWMAPLDNGSHISNYILEFDDGKGNDFIEVIRTKGKQYTLPKLQPSTHYSFRLAAVNEVGPSLFSDIIIHSTLGNPPQTPKPPTLRTATSNSLLVAWERRANDEEFVLQISDTKYGFMNTYNGLETQYECKNLKRSTAYQFRLRADNDAGSSAWCNEVMYKTHPERPGRPAKPQVKGKIHGTSFKARWDPPNDRGGADIKKYFLEISCGAKFERIYTGTEAETVCDRLSPGTTYQIKVACEGPGGISEYSDIFTVTTEAIVPGAPEPPCCSSPPGPYGAVLRWEKPDYNGGAPVLKYDLQLNGLNHDDSIVYHGKESYCVIKDLSPGEEYQAHVRAVNRIGAGAWSEALTFSAGAAPPYAPESLELLVRSATHLTVSWKEPVTNGASITGYRLESSNTDESNECFHTCYQGIQTSTDLRNLIPFTLYYFRVCAINTAGTSLYSSVVSTQTPAAVPSAPHVDTYEITATEVKLLWSEPEANGSKILYYMIEFGDQVIQTDSNCTEYKIGQLESETSYKFKVQAVNEIGAGQFSASLKLTTLPPPPEPPKLECTGSGHNFIKLKWGEGRNLDYTSYYVEMYINRAKEFQVVYKGTSFMCKVHKLQEQQDYRFRIYAETDKAGIGDYSPEYVFSTCATLPSNIKVPRVMEFAAPIPPATASSSSVNSLGITGPRYYSSDLTVEWQHSKNTFTDPIEYVLQCSCAKEHDYKELYRGPETHYTIENLEPGSTYLFRVCPIRITATGDELPGTYTNPLRYQVPHYRKSIDTIDAALTSSTNLIHHHRSVASITGGLLSSSDLLSTTDDNNSHHHHQHHLIRTSTNNNNHSNSNNNSGNSVRRITGKLTSIYSNRRRFSDQEKAILWMVFFIVATICFAVLVRMLIR